VGRKVIRTHRIDAWLQGLDPAEAGRALLAAGLPAATPAPPSVRPPITSWTLGERQFERAEPLDPRVLGAALAGMPSHRLAVESDLVPTEIVRRLKAAPEVSSAFLPVKRPVGSLRRRPWHWPMRVGLLGFDADAVTAIFGEARARSPWVENLLTGWRIEDEPSAVDVLVFEGSLEQAAEQLTRMQPVANAVVVLDRPLDRPALIEAQMAVARAATAAVASALIPPCPVADLLFQLVLHASHGEPFDVALSLVGGPETLLWAEPDGLTRSELPAITRREVVALEVAFDVPPPDVFSAREVMRGSAEGAFSGETHEASEIAAAAERVEPALEAIEAPRWSQAYVGADNVLRRGHNPVSFFIGPREQGALAAPVALDERQLPWEEENAAAFRLTVVFIPGVEDPEPQQAELDLPRFGRSRDVSFELDVADTATGASARILVLFRNRLLQTAVLKGQVDQEAELAELTSLLPQLAGLDDRRPFDAAVLANDNGGRHQLLRHSNGRTFVSSAGGVPAIAERLATILRDAAGVRQRSKKRLASEPSRKLMIRLAVTGRDLFDSLEVLGPFAEADRIQIVTARNEWLLPLELAYGRPAPDDSAKICDRFLADPETCNGACTGADDLSRLCPNAFWGLSKTIERHRFDPQTDEDPGSGHLLLALDQPRPNARTLNVTNALFAASSRVLAKDRAPVVQALPNAIDAVDWDGWKSSLAGHDTQLLVLLPHADYAAAELEISAKRLARGRIEAPYVTGGREVNPIVVLFGCRTTGTSGDPSGFAARFMQKGARVAFHSIADLLNVDASRLAAALATKLLEAGRRPEMLSDTLTRFRREFVHDGMIVAFAISAFGDADWRL
jgi:hypothetical protein